MNAKRTRNYYDMFAIMFNSQKSYRKYIENTHLGLLTETHEYYFGSLKHQIFIYSRWRHPPKTISPRPYCRSRRGRNGLGSETISRGTTFRLQRHGSLSTALYQTRVDPFIPFLTLMRGPQLEYSVLLTVYAFQECGYKYYDVLIVPSICMVSYIIPYSTQ